jgi:hypothetical protein
MNQDTLLHPEQSPVIQVVRRNGLHSWFVLRHLTPHPTAHGTGSSDGLPQPPLAT